MGENVLKLSPLLPRSEIRKNWNLFYLQTHKKLFLLACTSLLCEGLIIFCSRQSGDIYFSLKHWNDPWTHMCTGCINVNMHISSCTQNDCINPTVWMQKLAWKRTNLGRDICMIYRERARLQLMRTYLSTNRHEIWILSSQDSNWPPHKISWRFEFSLQRYLQNNTGVFW